MATYLLVHRHPREYAPSADTAADWIAWFEHLGRAVEDLGNPVFERNAVGDCGPATVLGGYTLITADDLNGAMELAQGCPIVREGGGVEVGVLVPVPGREHPARVF
jgi:hypothetical protein